MVNSFDGPFPASARVWVWVQIGGTVSPSNDLRIEVRRPDNSLYDTIEVSDGPYQYAWPAYWYGLQSMYTSATGAWRFDVLVNGKLQFSRTVSILP